MSNHAQWLSDAIARIDADFNRSSDTHLIKLDLPGLQNIDIYLKDESTHPTGSLKHRLARELGGHYMDQFTYAERATDWRGNNNIAESIFQQLQREPHPTPRWIVVSAGTGGTSSTIGRYIRYGGHLARGCELCVADPENSVFYEAFASGRSDITGQCGSRIEGIGRPRVEPSFNPAVIDRMVRVPDAASFAALRYLERHLGRRCGGSTGTNLIAQLRRL